MFCVMCLAEVEIEVEVGCCVCVYNDNDGKKQIKRTWDRLVVGLELVIRLCVLSYMFDSRCSSIMKESSGWKDEDGKGYGLRWMLGGEVRR